MAKEYLEKLTTLLADIPGKYEIKHFFSGAAAYVNGKICITLSPVGCAMKLPEGLCRELRVQDATPLRYVPKAPNKKETVVLPKRMLDDKNVFKELIKKSFAQTAQ